VAQGPPKRDAREAQASNGESVLFATKVGKRPGRGRKRSGDRDIVRDPVIANQEGLPRIYADGRGSEKQKTYHGKTKLTTD